MGKATYYLSNSHHFSPGTEGMPSISDILDHISSLLYNLVIAEFSKKTNWFLHSRRQIQNLPIRNNIKRSKIILLIWEEVFRGETLLLTSKSVFVMAIDRHSLIMSGVCSNGRSEWLNIDSTSRNHIMNSSHWFLNKCHRQSPPSYIRQKAIDVWLSFKLDIRIIHIDPQWLLHSHCDIQWSIESCHLRPGTTPSFLSWCDYFYTKAVRMFQKEWVDKLDAPSWMTKRVAQKSLSLLFPGARTITQIVQRNNSRSLIEKLMAVLDTWACLFHKIH